MSESKKSYSNMPIKCATIYKDYMWISSYLFNALFCFDYLNNQLKYMGKFENQDMGFNLHRQVFCYENKMFFIPLSGNGVDVYDVERQCFEDTIYDECGEAVTNKVAIQLNEKKVLLFSQKIQESLHILDLEERKLKCIPKWNEKISQVLSADKNYLVSAGGICADGTNIYLAIYGNGIVLKINVEEQKITTFFSEEGRSFAHICYCEGSVFVTEVDKTNVLQICEDKTINVLKNEVEGVDLNYCGMVCVNEGILLLPYLLNDIYFIGLKKKEIRPSGIRFNKENSKDACFFYWQVYEKNIILYPGRAQAIVSIDKENLTAYEIKLSIPETFSEEWILENRFAAYCRLGKGIVKEGDLSLQDFLKIIKKSG